MTEEFMNRAEILDYLGLHVANELNYLKALERDDIVEINLVTTRLVLLDTIISRITTPKSLTQRDDILERMGM